MIKKQLYGFVIFLALYTVTDPNLFSSTRTIYFKYCFEDNKSIYNCNEVDVGKQIYRPMIDKQIVTHTGALFETLRQCTIIDLDNWSCITDGKISAQYSNGKFSSANDIIPNDKIDLKIQHWREQISRFEYFVRYIIP